MPINGPFKKEALALAIAVLIALLILILTSGSSDTTVNSTQKVTANNTPEITTKIYSAGGIYLEYPSSWKITNDEISGNNLQLMIQDPTSASDTNSTQAAGFTVLKLEKESIPYFRTTERSICPKFKRFRCKYIYYIFK